MKKLILKLLNEAHLQNEPFNSPKFVQHANHVFQKTLPLLGQAAEHVERRYNTKLFNSKDDNLVRKGFNHPKNGVIATYNQASEFAKVMGLPEHLIKLDHSQLVGHMISHIGRHANDQRLQDIGTEILKLHTHINMDEQPDSDYFDHMQNGAASSLNEIGFKIPLNGSGA